MSNSVDGVPIVILALTIVDEYLLEAVRADGRFAPEEVDLDTLRSIVFTEIADGWQVKAEVTPAAIVLSLVGGA